MASYGDEVDADFGSGRVGVEDVLELYKWLLLSLVENNEGPGGPDTATSRSRKRKASNEQATSEDVIPSTQDSDGQQSPSSQTSTSSQISSASDASPPVDKNQAALYKLLSKGIYTPEKSCQINRLLVVLDAILDAKKRSVTKKRREIYYLDRVLFHMNQKNSDRIVEMLEKHWHCHSREFNVEAEANGTFAGPIRFVQRSHFSGMPSFSPSQATVPMQAAQNGDQADEDQSQSALAYAPYNVSGLQSDRLESDLYQEQRIPQIDQRVDIIVEMPISYVIIIEKETVIAQRVQELNALYQNVALLGSTALPLLITGKGMPSYNTRFLVELLCRRLPNTPIYVFADGDLAGIMIANAYMAPLSRSKSLYPDVNVRDHVTWLGMKPMDWRVQPGQPRESLQAVSLLQEEAEPLMPPRQSWYQVTSQGTSSPLSVDDLKLALGRVRRINREMAANICRLVLLLYTYESEAVGDVPFDAMVHEASRLDSCMCHSCQTERSCNEA